MRNAVLDLDDSVKETAALKQVLPDYRINLIDASRISHPEYFRTSLQHVFTMLKYNKDKRKLYDYAREHKLGFQNMDNDSMLALLALLGEQKRLVKIWEQEKGEEREADMCIAIDELIMDGKNEGRQEGENMMAALISRLVQDGRIEDVKLAASDEAARKSFYKEYGIEGMFNNVSEASPVSL